METSTKKYCATLRIEENVKFVGFLHDNQFVTEAYQAIAKRITTNHNELIQEERKKTGNHLTAETSPITPGTTGSADCEKEGIMDWIGLDWIGLDWIGLDWIGLDWIGLDWIGLDCGFVLYVVMSDVTIHPKDECNKAFRRYRPCCYCCIT
jgi:hypothetical protein